ncbi:MAG TPA: urease accessory UreF family protein [Streptosporangiaceae bacterium]|jgi:urease accessory protein|nr:urease accessory UreF family protein [Streptosporangiaceae bacterium]
MTGASAAAVLLADARFPAGGHAHSGGLEQAVTEGTVTGLSSLEQFLRGRLRTAGVVAAALAAAACARAPCCARCAAGARSAAGANAADRTGNAWALLDAEADARTPSPAQREASRSQGRALLRAARAAWPAAPWLEDLADAYPAHHAIVLGAAAAAAGATPGDAALVAAYQAVAGPASAAVRLLALDPMRVSAVLADLASQVEDVARRATAAAHGPLRELPFPSAPALDLLAEAHARMEVRLFAS